MATTGNEVKKHFELKIDKAYSAYFDDTKLNRLFKEVLTFMAAKLRKGLITGTQYDELTELIKTNQVFIPVNGNELSTSLILIKNVTYSGIVAGNSTVTVTTYLPHTSLTADNPNMSGIAGITTTGASINGTKTITKIDAYSFSYVIAVSVISGTYTVGSGAVTPFSVISDFAAHLASKVKFSILQSATVSAVTATSIMKVTAVNHNLRDGDSITIAGVTGTGLIPTNLNATHTITVLSKDTFSVPVSGVGGTYVSGGTISLTYYNNTKPWRSDQKIGANGGYGVPTVQMPKLEWTEKLLRFYPLTEAAIEIMIDYIAIPQLEIDCTNTIIDLEKYFSREFLLNDFLKEAAAMGELAARDYQSYQAQMNEIIQNP